MSGAKGEDFADPHHRMWTQVLAQALLDAIPLVLSRQGCNGERQYQFGTTNMYHLDQARAWLTLRNPDFRLVCALAGRDPELVLEHYHRQVVPRDRLVFRSSDKWGHNR